MRKGFEFMPEYKIVVPQKEKKREYWNTAIGLQQVDELEPSQYLIELSEKNISGELDHRQIEELLYRKYNEDKQENITARTKEADIVTNRMVEYLGLGGGAILTPEYLKSIHKYLFEGIYDHAGKFREYNISKSEMILNEESVKYANYFAIQSTLEYDMETMKKVRYTQMSADEMVDKIVTFTSSIWQVHPFMEGNTRTTALFIEQYLNGMGFDVNNQVFQEKAKYFRNALVRSNYSDYVRGIESTDDYLKKFFENLLLGKKHELRTRDLIVAACFE
jgi:fido (protein-threonine AMPylation protein)